MSSTLYVCFSLDFAAIILVVGEGSEDTGEYVGVEGRWRIETTLTTLCIEFVFLS